MASSLKENMELMLCSKEGHTRHSLLKQCFSSKNASFLSAFLKQVGILCNSFYYVEAGTFCG